MAPKGTVEHPKNDEWTPCRRGDRRVPCTKTSGRGNRKRPSRVENCHTARRKVTEGDKARTVQAGGAETAGSGCGIGGWTVVPGGTERTHAGAGNPEQTGAKVLADRYLVAVRIAYAVICRRQQRDEEDAQRIVATQAKVRIEADAVCIRSHSIAIRQSETAIRQSQVPV